jgi:cellulose synthase/poly-beta-1,6-N-acetylglucosamine synthase-like glycosyltransferase
MSQKIVFIVEWLFGLSAFGLIYTYIGYPFIMQLLSVMRPKPIVKQGITPSVSLIISAHNEERVIRDKIENSLALDYPGDKLQIIVVSDCSVDKTDKIVAQYADRGVELLSLPERKGKTAAQNMAVSRASGDIIVFSDASIVLESDSIRKMVRNFSDPAVGCVSCEDKSISVRDGTKAEDEGLYVRYEMLIRRWESLVGSIVGASGCFYGLRKSLWRWPDDFMVVDFTTPLDVYEQGFRTVSEPEAIAYVKAVSSAEEEFSRRIRTATRGQVGLLYKRRLLNPFKYGIFAFQLFSHKGLRFLAPFLLIGLLATNAILMTVSPILTICLGMQGLFYLASGMGFLLKNYPRRPRIFSFPFYFVMVNLAILIAWLRVLQGKTDTVWVPSRRVST